MIFSIAIDFSNRQQLCCDAQRLGDLLASALPHGFLGFLLGVGALRNAEAVPNFRLGEAGCSYSASLSGNDREDGDTRTDK